MKKQFVGVLGVVMSVAGCGSEGSIDAVEGGADSASTQQWQLVQDKEYPYVGEHGQTVCQEWESTDPFTGQRVVEAEYFHLDVINDQLAGKGELDPALVAALNDRGVTSVSTCEEARNFISLQHEILEADLSDVDYPPTDDVGLPPGTEEIVEKVAESQASTLPYVVRVQPWSNGAFGTCSGVLIGPRTLLTAAHCFFAEGVWDIRVDRGRGPKGGGDASVECISGGNSCANAPSGLNAQVFRVKGFAGDLDSAHDLAVVVNKTNWGQEAGIGVSFLPITESAPGAGESYWIDGYGAQATNGAGLGIHRLALKAQGIDDSAVGYWRDKVQKGVGRPCKGDSGSPAINTSQIKGSLVGPDLAIGLAQNADLPTPADFCPSPGAHFRYTRIEDKLSFIEASLKTAGLAACNKATTPKGWKFRFCF